MIQITRQQEYAVWAVGEISSSYSISTRQVNRSKLKNNERVMSEIMGQAYAQQQVVLSNST